MTPPPPLGAARQDLPEHACRAVHQALAKRPDDRFESVSDFVGALEGDLTNLATTPVPARGSLAETVPLIGGAPSDETVSQTVHVRPRPKRRGPALALFAAIAVVAAGSIWLTRGQLAGILGRAPSVETATPSRESGRAFITVGSRPAAAITINGTRVDRNPIVNHEVTAGEVIIEFEVTEQAGIWIVDTTVSVSAGDTLNLAYLELVRPQ